MPNTKKPAEKPMRPGKLFLPQEAIIRKTVLKRHGGYPTACARAARYTHCMDCINVMTCTKPEATVGRIDVYTARVMYAQRMIRLAQTHLAKDRALLKEEQAKLIKA